MFEEVLSLTDEGEQIGQQVVVLRFEYIDVSRTHAVKVSNGHFSLIRAPFAEENLSRPENIGECGAIFDVAPAPDLQVSRLDVIESHVALEPVFFGIA